MKSLIFIACFLTASSVATTTIQKLEPHYGSSNGATIITVTGSEFAEDSFNAFNAELGNTVYLVSDTNERECNVDKDATDENSITCHTGAMEQGTYYIRLKVNGQDIPDSGYCGGNQRSFDCSFTVVWWRTPLTWGISPESGYPDQVFTFTGLIYTDKLRSSDATSSNGVTASLRRVWFTGGLQCDLLGDQDVSYGVELTYYDETESYGNTGSFSCRLNGNFISPMNASFIIDEDYGRSKQQPSVFKVSSRYMLYMFQSYAGISNVTPSTGSTHGGTEINIIGNYFNDEAIQVMVGGANCGITQKTDTLVTCLTPSDADMEFQNLYPGSRGVVVEEYRGLADASEIAEISFDEYTGAKSQFVTDNSTINFVASTAPVVIRVRGFFLPAVDGHYHLYSNKAANTDIFLSTDNTADNKVLVAGQVALSQGRHYYYEMVHTESSTQVDVTLKAYLRETSYNYNQTSMARPERQNISSTSPDDHEIQTITLTDWDEVTSPTNEQLTLCITCNADTCTGSEEFYFSLHGIQTESLLSSGNPNLIKQWIEYLPTMHGDTVIVTRNSEQQNCFSEYTIEVDTARGHIPFQAHAVRSDLIGVALSTTVQPQTSRTSFGLAFNGIPSSHATVGDQSSVAGAVKSLFTPNCPGKLEQPGIAWLSFDFESGEMSANFHESSGEIMSEDSYCGFRSLKNPSSLIIVPFIYNNIDDHSQFCMAFKGTRSIRVDIAYLYTTTDSESDGVLTYQYDATSVWRHVCENLFNSLLSVDGSRFRLANITITADDSDDDLFIDQIFAGAVYLSDSDVTKLRGMRKPPQTDIKLQDVTVEVSGSDYTITMMAHDCRIGIPLLEAAYGTTNGSGVYTDSSWGSASITVARTQSGAPEIGGSFSVASSGGAVSGIPWNAEASEMEAYLESMPGLTDVTVTRDGSCRGYTWGVLFEHPAGDHEALIPTASFTNLAGEIVSTQVADGGLYIDPIPGDWLRPAYSAPQVEIAINNVPSICTDNQCSFRPEAASTPSVTSTVASGSTLTISGSKFSTNTDDNNVVVGDTECPVVSASVNEIRCTMQNPPSGSQRVMVSVMQLGDSNEHFFVVPITVDSINPSSGNTAGGTRITITGSGFSQETQVALGDSAVCEPLSVTYNMIVCTTGSNEAGEVDVTVGDSSVSDSSQKFTFVDTVASGSVSPTTLFVTGGELTISGSGFGAPSDDNAVYIDSATVNIVNWIDTSITVTAPSLAANTYTVNVYIHPTGYADLSAGNSVEYKLEATTLSAAVSSLMGGLELTVDGMGFDGDAEVSVGEFPCSAESQSQTSVTCFTGSSSVTHPVANTGAGVNGLGYSWEPQTLHIKTGDKVRWSWSQISGVSGASYQVFSTSSALTMTYDGNGFRSGSQTMQGGFEYQFNEAGTYYYGGVANSASNIFMRGVIIVDDASAVSYPVTVRVSGHEATYPNGALMLQYSMDSTPTITSVSPSSGTSHQVITIGGSRFSNNVADNRVTIGDSNCVVSTASDSAITCQIASDEQPEIGSYQEVKVRVAGMGDSLSEIRSHEDRHFVVLPHMSAFTPTAGSLNGGTRITISGGGLADVVSVKIGGETCLVTSSDYGSVSCTTSAAPEGSYDIEVIVNSHGIERTATCVSSCSFSYSSSATVSANSVTPPEISGQTTVTIEWDGEATDTAAITLGSTPCTITEVTNAFIRCMVDGLAHGTYDVTIDVAGKGLADSSLQVTSPARLDSIDPTSGSVNGFTTVKIYGNGFVVDGTAVSIGDLSCQVVSVTTNVIECITASSEAGSFPVTILSFDSNVQYSYNTANTPEVTQVTPSEGSPGDEIVLTVNVNTYSQQPTVELGGVACAVSQTTTNSITCTLGSRYGGDADISVVYPEFGKANVADGVMFSYAFDVTASSPLSGSLGGGQALIITGYGFSEVSTVTICGLDATVTAQSSTSLTVLTPAHDAIECQVIVANPGANAASPNTFTYDATLTPEITSVSPTSGGTGGGTVITISGSKLQLVDTVTIDGVECGSLSTTDTEITCTTNSHVGSIRAAIQCSATSGGLASGNVEFYYVDKWSSVFTWGGVDVPQDGEFVTISEGQTILLDTTTNKLRMLLIQGGELIFENEGSVHLQAENILITSGGLLQIGTEDEEYTAQAQITMHGNLHSTELPIYGAKTLGVRNGRLEMHGKHVNDTWALLDETAAEGSNQIILNIPVSWSVGDRIVIASTGLRHSQIENEEREISAIQVTADGKTIITFTDPLEYEHVGVTETYTDTSGNTYQIDYRAEVGLLSHNIVFRGSEDLTWAESIPRCPEGFDTGMFVTQTCFQGRFGEETGSDQYGASIMIHSRALNTDPYNAEAQAHIEYVELTYVGQAFKLGRYPIHWHLMGDMTGNYVRGCSIHRTFNRAVTIHNTHNLLVERNVIYNVMGGAFFIEDGIETGNIIQYNLAVFVRQSTSLLNDDITPAAYWVTNPNNTIQHNHAAGGTHFGFWYRMHENPDGPSYDPDICQQNYELGTFRNNSAHSQGWFGLWIFQVYLPREGSGCNSVRPMAAKFHSLTSWHCEKGAEWVEGGAIQFIDFKLASHEDSAIDIKLIFGTEWSKEDRGAMIKDSLIIGRANFEDAAVEGRYGIVLPFAPGLWIDGVTFVNFAESDHTAFFVTHISGTCTDLCGGWHYRVENLKFINTNTRIIWRWEHEGVIDDLDGSFTGDMVASKVVPRSDIYVDGTRCLDMSGVAFSPSGAYPSMKCSSDVTFHRIAFNDIQPTSLRYKNATYTRSDGDQYFTKSYFAKKRLTHAEGWMVLLPGGYTYLWAFEEGGTFVNMTYNAKFYDMYEGDYIIIKHEMPQPPSRIALCGAATEECNFIDVAPSSGNAVTSSSLNREWHYDDVESLFTYIVTRKTSSRKRRGSMSWQQMDGSDVSNYIVRATIERCLYEDCEVPSGGSSLPDVFEIDADAVIVTSFNDTGDCFGVEGDGDDRSVTIPTGCWVVWAIPSGTVTTLNVDGNLVFNDDQDIALTATYIVVKGRFIGGFSVMNPRLHRLDITLQGTPSTTELVASSGVTIGSKVLACHGTCDLHGKDVVVSWTKLAATATAGSNQIVLSEPVPWSVSDEIVIAPTGFNAWRTEKRSITAISADMLTLTLNSNLLYGHKSETRTFGSNSTTDFSAEVGVLTRSITISGDESADSYGPRVLVTTTETRYTAKGRFTNVAFVRTGQEGHYDDFDPRHSLTFKNAGTSSQVRKCAFHDGYATAIGTYGTDEAEISGNVIHHTVNEGVVIKGYGHELLNNLVVLNIFRGSYQNRMETTNYDYTGAINVESATHLTMTGNVVAGAERVAYRISGQPCETLEAQLWSGNVAHATLLGAALMKTALQGCSLVNGFTLYNVWDFGIYHQTTDNVRIENCSVVDATVGYMPLIAGPDPLTHAFEAKSATVKNCVFVPRRDLSDCDVDISESTDHSLIIRRLAGVNKKAPSTPSGGRTGVMLALFEGDYNGANFKALHVNMNYPALYGLLKLEDVTFANFKHSCSATDAIFFTNPLNEDVFHPTHVSGIVMDNCEPGSYVYIDKPEVSNINPSDCVDMQCDAKLKVLINDEDGSFLGEAGSIISQSERDWGDQTLGLGDYRIPNALLTAENGTKLQAANVVPWKGIARKGDSCELKSEWQGYKCTGDTFQYRMMVIESLDSDTETRRLSPIALKVGQTVDLINGPQDHGWCSGYTCQKRISTFYTIVPEGEHIDVYFSSTPPLQSRLHLINSPASEKVTVAIWIPSPQKLNVRANGALVDPSNKNGNRLLSPPASDPDMYKPDATSCSPGENYLDLDAKKLYICLVGGSPVDIETEAAIIVNMMFPAITIDEFFDTNLESNLASLLNIDVSNIRRVNVVSEQSRRRRSAEVEVSVEVLANSQDEAVTRREQLVEGFQSRSISVNGVVATGMTIGGTQTADDITEMDTLLQNGGTVNARTEVGIPAKIDVTTIPTGAELSPLSVAPVVHILDESDVIVVVVADSYQVSVVLDTSGADADTDAVMSGTTTLLFTEGVANFSDLTISHSGTYNLVFSIPSHNISDQTVAVVVQERSICAGITGLLNSELANEGDSLQYQLQLTDCGSSNLQNIDHKGYSYLIDVSFDESSLYGTTSVAGTTTFTFDSTGALTTSGLSLSSTANYNVYNLNFRLYTSPTSSYDKSVGVRTVQIYPSDSAQYIHNTSNKETIKLSFSENYNDVVGNPYSLEAVETGLYNDMVRQYPDLYFTLFTATSNSGGNLQIDTTITAKNETSITNFYKNFDATGTLSVGTRSVTVSGSCSIQISGSCYQSTDQVASSSDMTTVIVFSALGACVVLSIAIITGAYLMKRHSLSKISAIRCMDGSPNSLRPLHDVENEISWSRTSSPGYMEHSMTPVERN